MIEAVLRLLSALLIVGGLAFVGWTVTLRLEPCARLTRWIAAFVVSASIATAVFLALAFARIVAVPSMLSASVVLAAIGFRAAGRERIAMAFAADFAALREAPARIGRPAIYAVAMVTGAHVILAAASACSPLLGFDSLTYHLLHVGHWAQDGGFARHPGVDSWGYYEFFPIGGEILWAWVAIPTRSNVLIGPAGVFLSLMTVIGTVSAARSLGATLQRSVLAAAALVAVPAISMFVTNGYVDNTALLCVVSATALILAAIDADRPGLRNILLVLASLSLGIAVGVKTTMASMLGLGLVTSVVLLIVRRARIAEIATVVGAGLSGALLLFVPRMLWVMGATGSPLYPFPLRLFGREISQGNVGLQKLAIEGFKDPPPFTRLVTELFVAREGRPLVNFSVSGLALFVAGVIGIVFWFRRRPRDARVLFLFGLMIPMLMFFVGDSTRGMRGSWWWVVARFMTPAAFSAVLFAATAPNGPLSRIVDVLLGFAVMAGLVVPLTKGMCGYRWIGAVSVAVTLAAVVALAVAVWRQRRTATAGIVAVGVVGLAAVTVTLRGELESLIARGAARGECFEAHPGKIPAAGFPVWERLADAPASTIAVAAGFEGVGHMVWRYPLLGRRWQHRLVYVAPTADGKLYDHPVLYMNEPAESRPELSFERWRERLHEQGVRYVVLLGPYNIVEHRWLALHPEQFRLEEVAANDASRLYVVIAKE